jgi:hypothetical protein
VLGKRRQTTANDGRRDLPSASAICSSSDQRIYALEGNPENSIYPDQSVRTVGWLAINDVFWDARLLRPFSRRSYSEPTPQWNLIFRRGKQTILKDSRIAVCKTLTYVARSSLDLLDAVDAGQPVFLLLYRHAPAPSSDGLKRRERACASILLLRAIRTGPAGSSEDFPAYKPKSTEILAMPLSGSESNHVTDCGVKFDRQRSAAHRLSDVPRDRRAEGRCRYRTRLSQRRRASFLPDCPGLIARVPPPALLNAPKTRRL